MDEENESKLIRIIYIILFYLIYSITDLVLLVITAIQTILNLFTGEPSQSLRDFGSSLGQYLKQIACYLSYSSNSKPYPFDDWPAPDRESREQDAIADTKPTEKGE